jgi:hypothetical protein
MAPHHAAPAVSFAIRSHIMRDPLIASAVLLAALAPTAFADYTTTILTPPGAAAAVASAVSNGQAAGADFMSDFSLHAWYSPDATPGTDYSGGYAASFINGLSPTLAVGYVNNGTGPMAAFWTPPNATPQLLSQSNATDTFTGTAAGGVSGTVIVGSGTSANASDNHALVWNGTAADPVDLHNVTGFAGSYLHSSASGTDGTHAVGAANVLAGSPHAILWNITASTFTDLHNATTGLQNSSAVGIAGNQIVGSGLTDNGPDSVTIAVLWTLTGPADAVTYTPLVIPAGFTDAQATATNGSLIVGTVGNADTAVAIVWTSPTTYELLPTPDGLESQAAGIDADGNIVGLTRDLNNGLSDAILWSPASAVPEPASLTLLLPAAGLLFRRRRRPRL